MMKKHTKPQPEEEPAGRRDRARGADRRLQRDARLPRLRPADPGRLPADSRAAARSARAAARTAAKTSTRRRRRWPGSRTSTSKRSCPSSRRSSATATSWKCRGSRKVTLNMGVGEAKTNAKVLDDAVEELAADRRPAAGDHQGAQVDRQLQAARGHGHRLPRDAARRAHVRDPRPARLDRAAAHPRLPRHRRPVSSTGAATSPWACASRPSSPRSTTTRSSTFRGLNIVITTTAKTDEEGRALLTKLGMPFRSN